MRGHAAFRLPAGILRQILARVALRGLGNYKGLERWLAAHGYSVSSSSLHRALSGFEAEALLLRRARFLQVAARPGRLPLEVALLAVVLGDLARARGNRTRRASP